MRFRSEFTGKLSPAGWAFCGAGALLILGYAGAGLFLRPGAHLNAAGDLGQCLAAVLGCVGLAAPAIANRRRSRTFWWLWSFSALLWLGAQGAWTYFEVVLRQDVPNPFLGDVVFFLRAVPIMGALALRPHDSRKGVSAHIAYLDSALLVFWWVYLYVFAVIPWQYVSPQIVRYGVNYDALEFVENGIIAAGLAYLFFSAKADWRRVYLHLLGASLTFAAGAVLVDVAIDRNAYYTGSAYDIPLIIGMVWMGFAGVYARHTPPAVEPETAPSPLAGAWVAAVAIIAVFSMPVFSMWNIWYSSAPVAVKQFRGGVTQSAILVGVFFIFLRQRWADRDRSRLLEGSQRSFETLKSLQSQMIQAEKLVSVGQLAAGAAHEINNPLTGILGYSDLLLDDPTLSEKHRARIDKIRTLARRIEGLTGGLLSFARRVPPEKSLLDINQSIATAIHLSNLDLKQKSIHVDLRIQEGLPPVRGDDNQILQVFFNLIDNAVDALEEVGGGSLIIQTGIHDASVLIEFSDSGPGIQFPSQVFDPFFTTKPVGKGTGLGLSICYGIVQEHGGRIQCFNRAEGGATFLVELPIARVTPPADPSAIEPLVHASAGPSRERP
jgi:signal transduction histidine kinase